MPGSILLFAMGKTARWARWGMRSTSTTTSTNTSRPRPLEEIETDIKTLEREILEMLRDVAG
jgi:hypothetical protein